jgi:hypothetical protein
MRLIDLPAVCFADASIVTRTDVRVDVVSNNTCRLAVSR